MDNPFPTNYITEAQTDFANTNFEEEWELDHFLIEGVFRSSMIWPLQRRHELAWMMLTADQNLNIQCVMEIGADKGGGILHWTNIASHIIASEIRGTPYQNLMTHYFPDNNFCFLEKSSYDPRTVGEVRHWLDLKGLSGLDVLFIDGDKSHFETDFYAYLPLMNDRSIVFLHDIQDSPGPKDAYWKIVRDNPNLRHQEYIDLTDYEEAKERMENGESLNTPHENWLLHWKGNSCGVGTIFIGF